MADKVPRMMPGVDIKKLKLDATDGFLLTRIDGRLTPIDLSRETGLPDFTVSRALEKLEKLGVIEIVDPSAPPPKPPEPPAAAKPAFDVSALPPKYAPSELDEACDLTIEQKKKILDYFYRLEDLDHYQLLAIDKSADKKTVKRAYNALAVVFHPDRYFKKNLGSFKPKMTEVFNKITQASDTLVDAEQRAEYDAYLAEVTTTRGMEALLEQAIASAATAAQAAQAQAEAQAQARAAAMTAPPPSAEPPPPSGPSAADVAARKAALAARLRAGARPVTAPPKPAAPAAPNPLAYASSQDAMDALKRRYEQRLEHATQAQAQRHVQAAEDALAKNDLVAAATSLSVASKFAPDDVELANRAKEAKARADSTLRESYLKQAQYEEKQRLWTEAARSWVKVTKLRDDDAEAHERAANAILRSDEPDLREAAEHAKRAITLNPSHIGNHTTLVEIYLAAGLTTSATRAAEAAHALDPEDARVLALIKRIREGKS